MLVLFERGLFLFGSFTKISGTQMPILGYAHIHYPCLILINPATSYTRSNLATEAPSVSKLPYWRYPLGILQKLVPLFGDEYFVPQLLQLLRGQALPSVIDNPAREAYMSRTAFTLLYELKFMPLDTLAWRFSQWLQTGCETVNKMLEVDCTSGGKPVHTLL